MIVDFEFEPANRLCVYRISGQISANQLIAAFGRARAHPGWSDRYNFLTRLDNASLSALSAKAMSALQAHMAAADPVTSGPRRRAAIVCADALSRAMLTYWEMIAGETLTTEERIFDTEAEAREWLGEQ